MSHKGGVSGTALWGKRGGVPKDKITVACQSKQSCLIFLLDLSLFVNREKECFLARPQDHSLIKKALPEATQVPLWGSLTSVHLHSRE